MKAAIFEGDGKLTIKKIPVPSIADHSDEVLVEVEGVSICGTDVSIVKVPPAFVIEPGIILGHEMVGYISKKGKAVKNLQIGDRVVVNPNDYCGKCHYCLLNLPNLCQNMKAMGVGINGAFAEYVKTTEKVCYRISGSVPVETAVLAEPLACVLNGTNKLKAKPGEKAVILGAGPIGLLFLQMFKASGVSRVIMSEVSEYRRNHAKKAGADLVIDPENQDFEKIILKEAPFGPDIVVDAVGSQMARAVDIIGKGGRILIIGGKTDAVSSFKQINMVTKEISVLGTFLANASFEASVKILEDRIIDVDKLVTHKLSLELIHEGIEILKEGNAIKVVLTKVAS